MDQNDPEGVSTQNAMRAAVTDLEAGAISRDTRADGKVLRAPEGMNAYKKSGSLKHSVLVPPWCRYDPERPFQFPLSLNIIFAFAACFTVANLYYSHPILNLIAEDFGVTNEQASHVPTLAQAGYAVGLLLLCPLGDILRRRPFIICLVFLTNVLWIGLCITKSFVVFQTISFITAVMTVTPQLMIPLVGELAPSHRKSTALSIVTSGLLLGMLLARVLSGVVTRFIGWRYIYWIALGLQSLILVLIWLSMPDYPRMNEEMPLTRLPLLACILQFSGSACFGNFWTTLVFLLSGQPYNYSSLTIGLFALIGIGSMCWGPVFARLVMDKKQPLFSAIVGSSICFAGTTIGTYAGTHSIAGPIIEASTIEIGLLTTAIANRTAIYAQAPRATNRVNTAYMFTGFVGQLAGTAIGNAVYARSGWIASGSVAVAFAVIALLAAMARGPHEKGWVGWSGGYNMNKDYSGSTEKRCDDTMKNSPVRKDTELTAVTGIHKGFNESR